MGKGLNVYDVIVGLRTFPIIEKPLAATGCAGSEVEEDTGYVDDTGVVDEGMVDSEGEDWAWTAPRRVNKEHSAGGARNMVEEGR